MDAIWARVAKLLHGRDFDAEIEVALRKLPRADAVKRMANLREEQGRGHDEAVGGQIPEIIISKNAAAKGVVSVTGDHYGTLRTIEEAFGLPLLGAAASAANGDLTRLVG